MHENVRHSAVTICAHTVWLSTVDHLAAQALGAYVVGSGMWQVQGVEEVMPQIVCEFKGASEIGEASQAPEIHTVAVSVD